MSDEIKRPDRVLVVARDPENPPRKQDLRWLMMWMEGGSDMSNSAMATTVPVDLYQLIDGRWSFVGEPREAKPFMVDDQTMMVPVHERVGDREWTGFELYRKVDGQWRKTDTEPLDVPTVSYRDPYAETRDDRRKRLQEQFDRTGKMEISVCSENFTPKPSASLADIEAILGRLPYHNPGRCDAPDAKKTDGFSFETTAHGDQFASLPIGPTEHYTFSAPAQFGLIGLSDFDSISGRATNDESKSYGAPIGYDIESRPDQYHMIDQGLFGIPTHGVPIGYDIEVSDSPQPMTEQETGRPRGIIAQTGGRPISVVERPSEPPKQESWRDRAPLF